MKKKKRGDEVKFISALPFAVALAGGNLQEEAFG